MRRPPGYVETSAALLHIKHRAMKFKSMYRSQYGRRSRCIILSSQIFLCPDIIWQCLSLSLSPCRQPPPAHAISTRHRGLYVEAGSSTSLYHPSSGRPPLLPQEQGASIATEIQHRSSQGSTINLIVADRYHSSLHTIFALDHRAQWIPECLSGPLLGRAIATMAWRTTAMVHWPSRCVSRSHQSMVIITAQPSLAAHSSARC